MSDPAPRPDAAADVPSAEYDPAPDLRRVFAMHSASPPDGCDDGDRSPAINRVIASLGGGYGSTNLDVRDVRCLVVAFADAEGIIDALNSQLSSARADLARLRAPADLAAIEARAAAATPGPWRADHDFGHVNASALGPSHIVCGLDSELCVDTGGADIAFIAHAREDVPTLLHHIAAQQAAHAAALNAAEAAHAALAVARKAMIDAGERYRAAWDAVTAMPPTAAQSEEIAAALRVSYEAQDALSVALDALLRGAPSGYVRASVVRDLLARYRDGEVKRGDFLQALDAALAAVKETP